MSQEVGARKVGHIDLLCYYVHVCLNIIVYLLVCVCCVDFEEAISSYYQVIAESAAPIKQECPNGKLSVMKNR